jgi:hypothetical protein
MCWEELKFSDRFGLTSVIHTVGCDCVAAVLAARTDTRSSMRRGNAREEVRLELNPEPVNLARLIDEVIGTAGQLAEKNKNRLVVEAQENVGALTADPMRPKQILSPQQCLQVHERGRGRSAGTSITMLRRRAALSIRMNASISLKPFESETKSSIWAIDNALPLEAVCR